MRSMNRPFVTGVLFVAILLVSGRSAGASTITFSSFSEAGSGFKTLGPPVSAGGFTFTSTGTNLGIWRDADANHPVGGAAATSLVEFVAGSTTTMTQSGGGAFELNAIDLAEWGANQGGGAFNFSVLFTGKKSDLSTVTQSFTVANNLGSPVLQHFVFGPSFTDLTSVSFTQGVFVNGTSYQFDNIVVNASTAPGVVPESATLLLLATGVGGAMLRRRRRR